jgi:predicted glycosyltransferase
MHSKRRKILFYCQSLVGLGHLTSSLLVIRELSIFADVDLIHGGQGLQQMPELPGFRYLRLPTILIDSASDELYAPDSDVPIENVWAERAAAIERFLDWPYDAVIVEFFPFGRRRLKKEILGLFATVRQHCGAVPIFCFVREILVPAPLEAERRMVKLVREHIHTVFVRGDPNIVRFEETFSLTAEIEDHLVYLGYVSPPPPTNWPVRRNRIVVSQGGGEIGRILLYSAIRAAPLLPDYQFLIVASSRSTKAELEELQALAQSSNVQVVSFLSDFQAHLLTAALSISLGGDNTLMDVISTRTPALAFPYAGNSEQALRIEKLAQKGFVFPLTPDDLNPARLAAKIKSTVSGAYPRHRIDINGAKLISSKVETILRQAP